MSRLIIEAGKTGRHYGADLWRFREFKMLNELWRKDKALGKGW